jgi:uncharacterized protein (TIGR00730 family)
MNDDTKKKNKIVRVCVFCASSTKTSNVYLNAAEKLANIFVQNNIEVVFGGGTNGLMGRLADTVIRSGGKIKGIMPRFMIDVEWAHKGVTELIYTDTMHQRKELLLENIDALVAMPGGSGTFEELLEAITLKRLGKFTKPIVILNTNNFYYHLEQLLEQSIREGFMSEKHREMWTFVNKPEAIMQAIQSSPIWDSDALQFAIVK